MLKRMLKTFIMGVITGILAIFFLFLPHLALHLLRNYGLIFLVSILSAFLSILFILLTDWTSIVHEAMFGALFTSAGLLNLCVLLPKAGLFEVEGGEASGLVPFLVIIIIFIIIFLLFYGPSIFMTFVGVLFLGESCKHALDLRKLKKQLDRGVITQEEYEQKKKKLLEKSKGEVKLP